MFIREIWGKFTSLIFLKFIPNVPLKYVITSTYFMPYLYTGYSYKKLKWNFLLFSTRGISKEQRNISKTVDLRKVNQSLFFKCKEDHCISPNSL